MKRLRATLTALAIGLTLLALAPAAHAQATRTWVSGVGDDVNPCSRTAPCKTFAGAISKTAAGGEISVLDPGGFGAVTITKSITINGAGTLAGILASLTNGVIVNALSTDEVILRNISINGAGNGINGIRYLAGGQLTVENVTINGFTTRCIDVSLAANGRLFVQNTNMTNCPTGVRMATTGGQAIATFDNIHIENGTTGLDLASNSTFATVRDSVINNMSANAVVTSVGNGVVNIDNSTLAFNNGNAVNAAASGSRIRISNNNIVNNNVCLAIGVGAFIASTSDNRLICSGGTANPNEVFNVQ
ncbi:MAG TPA: right-handed parallel beta-helix repeat-containing protein [Thermoanaerobaculia bacterium]|nr:right-handed parallel beta-helix repeat-containing protein [Thermoanaerobaculia bacterium]